MCAKDQKKFCFTLSSFFPSSHFILFFSPPFFSLFPALPAPPAALLFPGASPPPHLSPSSPPHAPHRGTRATPAAAPARPLSRPGTPDRPYHGPASGSSPPPHPPPKGAGPSSHHPTFLAPGRLWGDHRPGPHARHPPFRLPRPSLPAPAPLPFPPKHRTRVNLVIKKPMYNHQRYLGPPLRVMINHGVKNFMAGKRKRKTMFF